MIIHVPSEEVMAATEAEARMPFAEREAQRLGEGENAARMAEGVTGCRKIAAAMRVYFEQNNSYLPLDGPTGEKLEETLKISIKQFASEHFKPGAYSVTASQKGFTVKAVMDAQTLVIDEKGVESGTYLTKK